MFCNNVVNANLIKFWHFYFQSNSDNCFRIYHSPHTHNGGFDTHTQTCIRMHSHSGIHSSNHTMYTVNVNIQHGKSGCIVHFLEHTLHETMKTMNDSDAEDARWKLISVFSVLSCIAVVFEINIVRRMRYLQIKCRKNHRQQFCGLGVSV